MTSVNKAAMRARLRQARRLVPDDVHAAEALLLDAHLAQVIDGGATVCGYVPVGTEPGSITMLDVLLQHGARVLLPVARTTDGDGPLPLMWGEYRPGELVRGRWGLLEPPAPWLPDSAVGQASLVLLPALAVDLDGVRLGKGLGFYDRSLTNRNPQARLLAIVRDEEMVDRLPSEPHDVRMTHAITPQRGVISFPHRE
ncbi:5-formyltetrahydrofolate cyclo-ligase family protein [Mycobacterium marinum]|uniref:5-formyltetrahydrofolate cyclo-ligase n=1 Tax=Mycobacterium marinum TaxID=1781 RepID=UPI000E3E0AC2|nr:5-formyltetrahydrofolate cyclo-ligase [Mycobacterium marinum]RFZ42906.1 5-formyltetrahydrofolate cyclo-ligase family protein [Mycobacterium marinum]RFZ52414.1 5-formyltetrahydrofolate cyclo-ligase family protein [Mycobacterium marinum]GJO23279.1 5-formyltetrahydrofolate cyclo-ligase [Mycobacterium marinum]GJO27420.1 5-formyltetrahydrofolate cyclo-ligase [Mycobacterium marinum]GJO28274.1 5-formyltetrahydrofolate cyclo-ligase [Mycobacterium marinum]